MGFSDSDALGTHTRLYSQVSREILRRGHERRADPRCRD
jgi:hypothetical protein